MLKAAGVGQVLGNELMEVFKHFGDDLDRLRLRNQLAVLCNVVEGVNPSPRDIEHSVLSLKTASSLFSEVIKLLQLLYVLPASTATAEQLRHLKTYLRNAMTPQRRNHMILLRVHEETIDQLHLLQIEAEFIARNERRLKWKCITQCTS